MYRAWADEPRRAAEKRRAAVHGDDVLDLDVRASADAIADVRHAVADHLAQRGVASIVVDDMELVASELVTNAIVHAWPTSDRPAVDVRVVLSQDISVIVGNRGSVATIPPVDQWRCASPWERSGRGLGIVRRLCDAVTVEQHGARAVITCYRRLPDGGPTP